MNLSNLLESRSAIAVGRRNRCSRGLRPKQSRAPQKQRYVEVPRFYTLRPALSLTYKSTDLCLNHLCYKTGDLRSQVLQMVYYLQDWRKVSPPSTPVTNTLDTQTLTCTCKGSGNIVTHGGQVHCLCHLFISVWPTYLEHFRFALASLALLDNRHGQPEKV